MADWATAVVDIEKFRDYSMNPEHPKNGGKHLAFEALGYVLAKPCDRERAARAVIEQLLNAVQRGQTPTQRDSQWGVRYDTATVIKGPNGRCGTLRAAWQEEPGSVAPRLITNWLELHKEEQEP